MYGNYSKLTHPPRVLSEINALIRINIIPLKQETSIRDNKLQTENIFKSIITTNSEIRDFCRKNMQTLGFQESITI